LLGSNLISDLSILDQVSRVDKSITIDSLSLVHPQFDKIVRLLDGLRLGIEDTLEDISQVTNIELIMEVLGSLSELLSGGNINVKLKSSLDHRLDLLENRGLESGEMLGEISTVDSGQGGILRHTNGKKPEMSLESRVDGEGTSRGVHGSNSLGVDDLHD
jgi:hypothetical protein